MKITIDQAGRVVIPKSIRESAGLSPGEPLEIVYRDGRIEIAPADSAVELVRKGKLTVACRAKMPPLTQDTVTQVLRQVREGRR